MDTAEKPYMTTTEAGSVLGHASGRYLTKLCTEDKIPGAYRSGGIWLVPVAWVTQRKEADAKYGIERGTGRIGRPVTTGAGLNRKRKKYAYKPTGKPKGRPEKTP